MGAPGAGKEQMVSHALLAALLGGLDSGRTGTPTPNDEVVEPAFTWGNTWTQDGKDWACTAGRLAFGGIGTWAFIWRFQLLSSYL